MPKTCPFSSLPAVFKDLSPIRQRWNGRHEFSVLCDSLLKTTNLRIFQSPYALGIVFSGYADGWLRGKAALERQQPFGVSSQPNTAREQCPQKTSFTGQKTQPRF